MIVFLCLIGTMVKTYFRLENGTSRYSPGANSIPTVRVFLALLKLELD